MEVLSTLFGEMDIGGCGILYRDDFRQLLQRPEVQALFSHFKFDIVDGDSFFTLLDVDSSGTVDIEEFVIGCLRMHGKSNAIDMEISIHETRQLAKRLVYDMERLQENGVKVHDEIHDAVQLLDNLEAALSKSVDHIGRTSFEDAKDFDVAMQVEGEVEESEDVKDEVGQAIEVSVCFSAETLSSCPSEGMQP